MNDFFSKIGVELSKDIPDTENDLVNDGYDINQTKVTFLFTPEKSEQVNKAMRMGEISSFFLKAGISILAEPLAELFKLSLSYGGVPRYVENR